MKQFAFSLFLLHLFLRMPVGLLYPVETKAVNADTIRINADSLEMNVDYSAMEKKSGIYVIGDTAIHLDSFAFHNVELKYNAVSFDKKFLHIAQISFGHRRDTVMIKGSKKSLKTKRQLNSYMTYEQESSGFINRCPPGRCYHYYVGVKGNGKRVSANNLRELRVLIPVVKKVSDAFFLIDDNNFQKGRYYKAGGSYYILINKRVQDCHMTFADILYRVDADGSVTELGRNITEITNLCI